MNPKFPIYIPSKGRWESRVTVKVLERLKVPFRVVVEESQLEQYASVIDRRKLLVLDPQYQRDYDACDEFGLSRSKGSGPARNFIWDHSVAEGHSHHWVVDDNIMGFFRLHQNLKRPVGDGTVFACMEDFALRYSNVAIAGPNYCMFASRKTKLPPFAANTRIYSCSLIRNDIPFRWRARYNEDTDLSLRVLKAGWCTIQFYAFLQDKMVTQRLKGGNTDELYKNGTLEKSQMIARLHPDVARVVYRFGRIHHQVDYLRFKANKLRRREPLDGLGKNNYGMKLQTVVK